MASAQAKLRSIDLRPYGLEPVTNREYKARIFTSALEYLKDGSIVVAFPAAYSSLDLNHERTFNTERATVLHFDPHSGKLLHRFEGLVSNELRFLAATADGGFLLVQRREVVFYSRECVATGSIQLPLDIESVEVSPSRRYITLAGSTGDMLHVTVVDTATRASVRQYEVHGGPIVVLSDGYATLKTYTVQGVSIGGVRRIAIVGHGQQVNFAVPQPKTVDLGMAFDCPVAFEAASDDSIVYATCGLMQVVDERGRRVFKDVVKHSTVVRTQPAMEGARLAYSLVRGPYAKTTEQLRASGKDFSIRVADLGTGRIVATVPIVPFPRIGGVFALSVDGRELAVMNDVTLEVFDLRE
ncbi:MAG: hypothetical protein ABI383_01820 [Acidobacteriaceae bacterium]